MVVAAANAHVFAAGAAQPFAAVAWRRATRNAFDLAAAQQQRRLARHDGGATRKTAAYARAALHLHAHIRLGADGECDRRAPSAAATAAAASTCDVDLGCRVCCRQRQRRSGRRCTRRSRRSRARAKPTTRGRRRRTTATFATTA